MALSRFLTIRAVKYIFVNNHGHSILRLLHVLPNFPFTTSETKYFNILVIIIGNTHGIYELFQKLPNDFKLRI